MICLPTIVGIFFANICAMPLRRLPTHTQTDQQMLYKEVIQGARSSAYPKNLSNQWLRLIARDIAQIRKQYILGYGKNHVEDIAGFPGYLAGPKLLITKLLTDYLGRPATEADLHLYDLTRCLNNYWDALSDEIVMRETGVEFSLVTPETLFFATRKIY